MRKKNKKSKMFSDNNKKNESFDINLDEIKQKIEKKKTKYKNGF